LFIQRVKSFFAMQQASVTADQSCRWDNGPASQRPAGVAYIHDAMQVRYSTSDGRRGESQLSGCGGCAATDCVDRVMCRIQGVP